MRFVNDKRQIHLPANWRKDKTYLSKIIVGWRFAARGRDAKTDSLITNSPTFHHLLMESSAKFPPLGPGLTVASSKPIRL